MSLLEDVHLADEVCEKIQLLRNRIAETMLQQVTQNSRLPSRPPADTPVVPPAPPLSSRGKKKQKRQARGLLMDGFNLRGFPCQVSGRTPSYPEFGGVHA